MIGLQFVTRKETTAETLPALSLADDLDSALWQV
jgi:hypothetical protein